jgi:Cytochrome P450
MHRNVNECGDACTTPRLDPPISTQLIPTQSPALACPSKAKSRLKEGRRLQRRWVPNSKIRSSFSYPTVRCAYLSLSMDFVHQIVDEVQQLPKFQLYGGSALLVIFLVWVFTRDPRQKHLPPGPKGLPIIGNTHQLPTTDDVSKVIIQWAREYGEIFRIRLGMTNYIYLNTPEAVKELMDKKSNIYSSRHRMPMALDTVSDGNRMLFMGYTKQWRELRKIMHSILTATQAVNYQPLQMYETRQLCVDLLDTPEQFYHHTRRYTTSVVMQVAYGHRVPNWDDKDVKDIYLVLDNFTKVTAPGEWIVDSFPTLANIPLWPLSNWRQKGRQMYEHDSKIYIGFWERLVKEIEDGTAQPCVGLDLYYKNKDYKIIPKPMIAYTVAGVLEAGSETVLS